MPDDGPTPGTFGSILPPWADENGRTSTHVIRSGTVVGHIRFASPGNEACFTGTPLHVPDDHLWTIDGIVDPWPGPLSNTLRDRLDPGGEADIRGSPDGGKMRAPLARPLPPQRRLRRCGRCSAKPAT